MKTIKTIIGKVKCCLAAVVRRFSNMHILHDYYVMSDQISYTGVRIIIERCRICGKMKDNLDC